MGIWLCCMHTMISASLAEFSAPFRKPLNHQDSVLFCELAKNLTAFGFFEQPTFNSRDSKKTVELINWQRTSSLICKSDFIQRCPALAQISSFTAICCSPLLQSGWKCVNSCSLSVSSSNTLIDRRWCGCGRDVRGGEAVLGVSNEERLDMNRKLRQSAACWAIRLPCGRLGGGGGGWGVLGVWEVWR